MRQPTTASPGVLVPAVLTLVLAAAGCGRTEARPTMASALEAVPLRLSGGQTVEVQLAGRQPASGACDPLTADQVRIRDGALTVTEPLAAPPSVPGIVRVVGDGDAFYVVGADGGATAWLDRTLATGDEDDVVAFVGVDLARTSSVAAVRAVTWLAEALDDAGAYVAVIRGPSGPADEPGSVWTAAGTTPSGRLVTVRSTGAGAERIATTPAGTGDPCAYRTATGKRG